MSVYECAALSCGAKFQLDDVL